MQAQSSRYKSLLSATDTIFLIICAFTDDRSLIQDDLGDRVIQNITNLTSNALQHRIPVFLVRHEHLPDGDLLSGHAVGSLEGIRTFEILSLNPFTHDDLRTALEGLNRSRLVVAGADGELSVTFAALSALEDGYDVYAVHDAVLAADANKHKIVFDRLMQAGAVPVTTRQVLSEWP